MVFLENLAGNRVLLQSRCNQGIPQYHRGYGLLQFTIFHKTNIFTGVLQLLAQRPSGILHK